MKRFAFLLALLLAASVATATPFSQITLDGRAEALGSTATGVEAEPASSLANPALLPQLRQSGASFLLTDWYGSGVRSMMAAWAQPYSSGGFSLSWHRFGLSDLWVEDEIGLGLGWRFSARGRSLDTGLRLRGLMVDVPGYEGPDLSSASRSYALDLALAYPLTRHVKLAFIQKSLLKGEMKLLEDGLSWPAAPREARLGATYLWRRDLALILEYRFLPGRDGEMLMGAEVRFFDTFHIRGGTTGTYATAGFGLRAERWSMDFAFQSRGRLGNTVTLSFSPLMSPKEAR